MVLKGLRLLERSGEPASSRIWKSFFINWPSLHGWGSGIFYFLPLAGTILFLGTSWLCFPVHPYPVFHLFRCGSSFAADFAAWDPFHPSSIIRVSELIKNLSMNYRWNSQRRTFFVPSFLSRCHTHMLVSCSWPMKAKVPKTWALGRDRSMYVCTAQGSHQEPLTNVVTWKPAVASYWKRMNNCQLVDGIWVSGWEYY